MSEALAIGTHHSVDADSVDFVRTKREPLGPWPRLRIPGKALDKSKASGRALGESRAGAAADADAAAIAPENADASTIDLRDIPPGQSALEDLPHRLNRLRKSTTDRRRAREKDSSPRPSSAERSVAGASSTDQRVSDLEAARDRGRRIRRACALAKFNGVTSAIFAGFSLLLAPFSFAALLAALALGLIAYNELRGMRALHRLDARAPRRLALNQVFFAMLLVGYGGWGVQHGLASPPVSQQYAQYGAEIGELMRPFDSVYRLAAVAVYGSVALIGLVFQGGTAWFYASRAKYLERYRRETPDWIIDLHARGQRF